jgi:hypothetical protein
MSTVVNQLPFGQRLGVFILAEISAVSASSVIILLGYIAVRFLNLDEWPTSLTRVLIFSIARLPFAEAQYADGD